MKKILIVEDEEAQRLLYKEEFSEMGYQVTLAASGEQALKGVAEDRPDLVILDIKLPGKDGLDTLREMLNDTPHIPVIINSAYSHYKENFMSWAAEEYIVKSADLTELKNAVKRILK
ncbi:MAG TPA: response regulator [Caldithrix sp.]|nr:response regulator [Caldithrix sp.]